MQHQLQFPFMEPPRPSTRTQSRDVVLFMEIGGTVVLTTEKDSRVVTEIKLLPGSALSVRHKGNTVRHQLTPGAGDTVLGDTGLLVHNPYPLVIKHRSQSKDAPPRYKLTFQVPANYSLHHLSYIGRRNDA